MFLHLFTHIIVCYKLFFIVSILLVNNQDGRKFHFLRMNSVDPVDFLGNVTVTLCFIPPVPQVVCRCVKMISSKLECV